MRECGDTGLGVGHALSRQHSWRRPGGIEGTRGTRRRPGEPRGSLPAPRAGDPTTNNDPTASPGWDSRTTVRRAGTPANQPLLPVYTAAPCRSGEGPLLKDFQSPASIRNSDYKEYACMLSCFSHVRLSVTLWSEYRPPGSSVHGIMSKILSSIQEYWGGLPCPPPGDLSNPCLFCLLHGRRVVLPLAPPGKPTVPGKLKAFPSSHCPRAA